MKFLKLLPILLLAIVCVGAPAAHSPTPAADREEVRMIYAQFRLSGKSSQKDKSVQRKSRQRRFVMPANNRYPRDAKTQQAGSAASMQKKTSRMTPDERRALRQQINEANQGIYKRKQQREPEPMSSPQHRQP